MSFYKSGKDKYPLNLLAAIGNAIIAPGPEGEPYWDEVIEGVNGLGEFGMRCFKSRTLVDGEPIYVTINALTVSDSPTSWNSLDDYYWGLQPGTGAYTSSSSGQSGDYYWQRTYNYTNYGIVLAVGRKPEDMTRYNADRLSQCLLLGTYYIEGYASQHYTNGYPPTPYRSIRYPNGPMEWLVVVKPEMIFLSVHGSVAIIGTANPLVNLLRKPVFLFTSTQPHVDDYIPTTYIDGEVPGFRNGYLMHTNYNVPNWPAVTFTKALQDRKLLTYPYYLVTNYDGQAQPVAIIPDISACGIYQQPVESFFNLEKGFFALNIEGRLHLFIRPSKQPTFRYYKNNNLFNLYNGLFNNEAVSQIRGKAAPLYLIAI